MRDETYTYPSQTLIVGLRKIVIKVWNLYESMMRQKHAVIAVIAQMNFFVHWRDFYFLESINSEQICSIVICLHLHNRQNFFFWACSYIIFCGHVQVQNLPRCLWLAVWDHAAESFHLTVKLLTPLSVGPLEVGIQIWVEPSRTIVVVFHMHEINDQSPSF